MQLPHIEALCERLYNSQSLQERTQAEQFLRVFGLSTEYVSHCKAILDNSQSPYAQLLASSSLLKVVTEHSLSSAVKLEMRTYFLTYLDSRGPTLESFVVTSLVQLLSRMTKLCWYEDDAYRKIVEEAQGFLEKGTAAGHAGHGLYQLGLKILNMLVAEMNQPTPGRTLTQHRKIAVAFRDAALLKTMQIALASLKQLQPSTDTKLKEQAISLALSCLSFDFVGTCIDDSAEEMATIQVPSTWRAVIENSATLQLFLDFYRSTTPPLSSMALECLVRLASVRRSLFTGEEERSKFLNELVTGTTQIMSSQQGLSLHSNYHEFCRLLGRLKTNYQLAELVGVQNYQDWIRLVAELTVNSLNAWHWSGSSVYYLLGLWSRLVSSMPYLKGDSPSLLDTFVPKISRAYINSRLESVVLVLDNNLEDDPLDNEDQMAEQMESLPYPCRFQYDKTSEYLCSLLDPLAASYGKGLVPGTQESKQLQIVEGQITWLVHIIAAILRGRLSSGAADSQEVIDGALSARIFSLLHVIDTGIHAQRYGERSRQRLDLAILGFFQSFRRVYVGEQVMHSSKVYTCLSERVGLRDHEQVLNVMLGKIGTNLKSFGACEEVVTLTLSLFQDLASGFMSGKLLQKLDTCAYILAHHTSDNFAFLADPVNARNRTTFYHTLARLLFMDESASKFKSFVAPLQQAMPARTVIGLFRDLRGIAMATSSRRSYGLLFNWLYPAHFPAILCCLEAWADTPEVTTAILKFAAEFVLNKAQRLTFDTSSPNGILLFREVSKIIVTFGNHVLQAPVTGDPYMQKYKGVWLSITVLTRALAGNYCNFGVFDLYGDPALKDALDMALKMVLGTPLSEIVAYRKVGKAYYGLLDVLCSNHADVIAQCDTATFTFLVNSLDAGLKGLDPSISSQCAAAVDDLVGHYFRAMQASPDEPPSAAGQAIAAHVQQRPELLPQLLTTLFELVLFEECNNQWSLSRPMLSLILVNEQIYNELRHRIIASQPNEKQAHLATSLDKLMSEVQRNLEPRNRDKFTQALSVVRHDFRAKR
eukprot:jgi/Astpho2/7395/fgenesh1_pm.00114_%23_12_t